MSGKKIKKSTVSRPDKKSKSRKSTDKRKKNKKPASKKKVDSPALQVPTSTTLETILIAPSDYVPVFHRDMNEIKVAEGPIQGASMTNTVNDSEDGASMISKDTQVVKPKKSSARSKTKKGKKPESKKSKVSSRRQSARSKNKSKKTSFMVEQIPKLADYVVESINGRIDNFPKQFDHNCSKKCPCPKGNKGRKSKKS